MSDSIVPLIARSDDGVLRVSSEDIAEGAGVEHRAVLQLLANNQTDFEEFGRVAFEMRPFATAGGTQHKRLALLNEQQAMLLMTYQRNTEQVRAFKVALIKAFSEMAQRLTAPALTGPALMAAALIEAQATIAEARTRVLELEPKADAWDAFLSSVGDYSVNEAAKILARDKNIHIGEGRLRALLEAWKWIYRHSGQPRAMQAQIETGRMAEKPSFYFHPETGEKIAKTPQVRITPKGIDAIARRMHEVAA